MSGNDPKPWESVRQLGPHPTVSAVSVSRPLSKVRGVEGRTVR